MNIRDIFVIYLSAGTPFAVWAYLQHQSPSKTKRVIAGILAAVGWPYFAAVLIRDAVAQKSGSTKSAGSVQMENEIAELRAGLEGRLRDRLQTSSAFEWQETYERYCGLSLQLLQGVPAAPAGQAKLRRIANNSNSALAERCISKRNRDRLVVHRTQARNDLFGFLCDRTALSIDDAQIVDLLSKLAALLEDDDARCELTAMVGNARQNLLEIDVESVGNDVWNPQTQKSIASHT